MDDKETIKCQCRSIISINSKVILEETRIPTIVNGNMGRLEIWTVKLRFLLIYENMLKSIAMARSQCTAKHENKASYNTDYIVPDLIGDD